MNPEGFHSFFIERKLTQKVEVFVNDEYLQGRTRFKVINRRESRICNERKAEVFVNGDYLQGSTRFEVINRRDSGTCNERESGSLRE